MKEKVKIFMNNKALKKKIVTALLTVSSLYFMELLEISVVEASAASGACRQGGHY